MDLFNNPYESNDFASYAFVLKQCSSIFLKHLRGVLYYKLAAFANLATIQINNGWGKKRDQ